MKANRFEVAGDQSLTAPGLSGQADSRRELFESRPTCSIAVKGREGLANLRSEGINLQELASQQSLGTPVLSETARTVLGHF